MNSLPFRWKLRVTPVSRLLSVSSFAYLHYISLLVTFGSSLPSRPGLCFNGSAFHHLKVAAGLPYLSRSAGKIGVNRILFLYKVYFSFSTVSILRKQ